MLSIICVKSNTIKKSLILYNTVDYTLLNTRTVINRKIFIKLVFQILKITKITDINYESECKYSKFQANRLLIKILAKQENSQKKCNHLVFRKLTELWDTLKIHPRSNSTQSNSRTAYQSRVRFKCNGDRK